MPLDSQILEQHRPMLGAGLTRPHQLSLKRVPILCLKYRHSGYLWRSLFGGWMSR